MSSVDEYYSSEEEEEEGIEGGGDCGAKEDSSMALRQSLRTTKKMLSGRWGNYVEGMARQVGEMLWCVMCTVYQKLTFNVTMHAHMSYVFSLLGSV